MKSYISDDQRKYYNEEFQRKMIAEDVPHWEYKGKKYHSKMQAYLAAKSDWSSVHFNLYDNVFTKYDWTQRPDIDIEDMYDRRIIQLREKYDYIRIGYSGGTDSTAMLRAAHRTGVHVDEIFVYYVKDCDIIKRAEVDRSIKQLEQFGSYFDNTKLTMIGYGKEDVLKYYEVQPDISSSTYFNGTPNQLDYFYKHTVTKEFADAVWYPIEKGLSHCDIYGKEPSIITKYDDKLVWYLPDHKTCYNTSAFSEWFYTSGDMPEFQSLQNWLSVDVMLRHGLETTDIVETNPEIWTDMLKTTKRYVHEGAFGDKARRGTRKDVIRVYQYMDDPEFKQAFLNNWKTWHSSEIMRLGYPKISCHEANSYVYGLEENTVRSDITIPFFGAKRDKLNGYLSKEETEIVNYFKTLWLDLGLPGRDLNQEDEGQ